LVVLDMVDVAELPRVAPNVGLERPGDAGHEQPVVGHRGPAGGLAGGREVGWCRSVSTVGAVAGIGGDELVDTVGVKQGLVLVLMGGVEHRFDEVDSAAREEGLGTCDVGIGAKR
jgi:hypothetical protein